jgi:hypothetical protein
MKQNMGSIDRGIRVLVAFVIGILYFTGLVTGTVAIILLIVALVFLLTSTIAFCPLYVLFKCSTKKEEQKA